MLTAETAERLNRVAALIKVGKEENRHSFDQALENFQEELTVAHLRERRRLRSIEQELDAISTTGVPDVSTYVMGSLFLDNCKEKLTMDEKENMFYVSGVEADGYIYLTDILTFEFSKRSVGGVHGDDESVFKAMMRMERTGHRLFAWFHSHPGEVGAFSPSSIDRNMQKRLESLNYPTIGAVFTRDGHVRFFSNERPFQIQIHGKGVKNVASETHLYQMDLPD